MSAAAPAVAQRDGLIGFVFLFEEGPLRGEVAIVRDVAIEPPRCILETTRGPAELPREYVATLCQRVSGIYHPVLV